MILTAESGMMKSNLTVSDVTGDEVGYHGGASEYTAGRLGKEHRVMSALCSFLLFSSVIGMSIGVV
ncbi:hypothetical protein PCCS19_12370 [Paenibacillus sp. CCS19]|nr:hypothetical protein PCCS19_12370 [Paenibacillus cellulosilyticus]